MSATTGPARTPERQRLALAIDRHRDAVAQRERVADALTRLDDRLFEVLQPAVRGAREALEEAIKRRPDALVAEALGEPANTALPTVADAEAALEAADQKLAEARATRDLLRDEMRDREVAADRANSDLDRAVSEV